MTRTRANMPIFPDMPPPETTAPGASASGTGVLPRQQLEEAIAGRVFEAGRPIAPGQLQPASVDLRLGARGWRVRASFLPGRDTTVAEKAAALGMHEFALDEKGALFEKGCVYIVELEERVRIPRELTGLANPKSSTGRLDVFTRLIADRSVAFDRVPGGYHGPLHVEIAPRTFSILARRGSRLCQLRLKRGAPPMPHKEMRRLQDDIPLLEPPEGDATIREDSAALTLDLAPRGGAAGFRARKHAAAIDIDRRDRYDPREFWDPVVRLEGGGLVMDPDDFHILATRERVRIPPGHAAEMVAYDTMVGEFRAHYAGFFDPGFGYGPGPDNGPGARAVLEVRSRDVPFVLEHGQTIGWLRFEKLAAPPDRLYGAAVGSSYQAQGLKLGKQFRAWSAAGA